MSSNGPLFLPVADLCGSTWRCRRIAERAAASPRTISDSRRTLCTVREFRQRERQNLLAALVEAGWKIYGPDGAAALLGMKPTTLISRMKTLRIERPAASSKLDGLLHLDVGWVESIASGNR